jgi:hypothetical protein
MLVSFILSVWIFDYVVPDERKVIVYVLNSLLVNELRYLGVFSRASVDAETISTYCKL